MENIFFTSFSKWSHKQAPSGRSSLINTSRNQWESLIWGISIFVLCNRVWSVDKNQGTMVTQINSQKRNEKLFPHIRPASTLPGKQAHFCCENRLSPKVMNAFLDQLRQEIVRGFFFAKKTSFGRKAHSELQRWIVGLPTITLTVQQYFTFWLQLNVSVKQLSSKEHISKVNGDFK